MGGVVYGSHLNIASGDPSVVNVYFIVPRSGLNVELWLLPLAWIVWV